MNTTSQAPVATLAEFIETEKASDLLFCGSGYCGFDYAGRILNDGGIDWIRGRLDELDGDPDAERSILGDIEESANELENIVSNLRNFVAAYFEHRGTIKEAVDAIEAFVAAPNEANRLALEVKSKALDDHYIPMPQALKRKLRPFVTNRYWRSGISFKSLAVIARDYLKVEAATQEAA